MKNNVFAIERKRLGLTQEQLAKKLNTSRSNVANWENGFNMPSYDLLFKCSDIFNCDVMYLVGYQNERISKDDDMPLPEPDENEYYDNINEFVFLRKILRENGILNRNEEFTKNDYDHLIEFIKANKTFIIKKE